jgi:DNA polymerase-3 subunit epsilon
MKKELSLTRSLVFFDLETTGTDIQNDRIVEISIVKLFVDGHEEIFTQRVNPGMHISEGATAVHGITDADVADSPNFTKIANDILGRIIGSDLCGYNLIRFDFPLLRMEFFRNNIEFNIDGINLIDPMKIFMMKEPRNLTAALQFYCNKNLANAHSAEADTLAAKDILLAQIARYDDVPNTVSELSALSLQGVTRLADITGRLVYNANNEICFNFGLHRGERVIDNRDYVNWMIGANFPADTVTILRRIHNIH